MELKVRIYFSYFAKVIGELVKSQTLDSGLSIVMSRVFLLNRAKHDRSHISETVYVALNDCYSMSMLETFIYIRELRHRYRDVFFLC